MAQAAQNCKTSKPTPVPIIVLDNRWKAILQNSAARDFLQKLSSSQAGCLFQIIREKGGFGPKDDLEETISNFQIILDGEMGLNRNIGIHVFPFQCAIIPGSRYLTLLIPDLRRPEISSEEARYLHYLKTIHKISSKSYHFNTIELLSQYIVSQLFNEEYNFFHVAIFLKDEFSTGKEIYLAAIDGESRLSFSEHHKSGYRQSIHQGVIGKTIRRRKSIIIDDTEDIEYYHFTPFFKGKSEICVPIYLMENIVGVINIESKTPAKFDEVDVAFLESVANLYAGSLHRMMTNENIQNKNKKLEEYLSDLRLAKERLEVQSKELQSSLDRVEQARVLIENQNIVMQHELKMGVELQKSLLPRNLPQNNETYFCAKYLPTSDLGGDFFDVVQIDTDHLGIVVADVSGHGVSAAMIAAMFKAMFSNYMTKTLSPSEVLSRINSEFSQMLNTGDFISAFYMVLELSSYKIKYANAGHPFPLFFHHRTGKIDELDSPGFFIGVFHNTIYQEESVQLAGGDKILFYTDGVTEVKDHAQNEYGRAQLRSEFRSVIDSGFRGEAIIDAIYRNITTFRSGSTFDDDLTLLLLEHKAIRK